MSWQEYDGVPEGWSAKPLAEITKVVGGGTPKTTVPGNFSHDDGHPWITPSDLTNYRERYINRGRRFLTDQGLKTSSAVYMPAGTVLFSSRAPIGYVAIASEPVTTNQGFRSFLPNEDVDPEYLYHALRLLRPLAEHLASGTTFAELSGTKAGRMVLAYPGRAEQRQIVAALDAVDARRETAARALGRASEIVNNFRQAVLTAACSGRLTEDWRCDHPGAISVEHAITDLAGRKRKRKQPSHSGDLELPDVPDTWVLATVADAAVVLEYGTSKKADGDPTDVPVLRMGNIQNGELRLEDLKYCASDAEIERLMLRDGDLLFNRTNSPKLVGKAAVYHEPSAMTFASYLIRVRFAGDVAQPDFVSYWINSAWGRVWARQVKTDGVSQSNINGTKLCGMPLPLPPIDEQREIVQRVEALLAGTSHVQSQIEQAAKLLDRTGQAALAMAFRGELIGDGAAR